MFVRHGKIDRVEPNELLTDLFARVDEHVRNAVVGLGADALVTPPAPDTNTIGWLVWHLSRVQDLHIAEILADEQVWMSDDWAARFGVSASPDNHGYGHSVAEMLTVRPDGVDALLGYYDAVATRTRQLLARTTATDLDRVVDQSWEPPVTLGVRLVSIADDCLQHAGQASYARGILERR
jgi:Protein of unknown function (DUF664)